MRIYLASTAPGNEAVQNRTPLNISKRLLSYFCIQKKQLENHKVFNIIKIRNESK